MNSALTDWSSSRFCTRRSSSSHRPGTPASASSRMGAIRNCAMRTAERSASARAEARATRSLHTGARAAPLSNPRRAGRHGHERDDGDEQERGEIPARMAGVRAPTPSPGPTRYGAGDHHRPGSAERRRSEQPQLLRPYDGLQLGARAQLAVERFDVAPAGELGDAENAGDRL